MISKSIDHLFVPGLYFVICLGSLLTVLCCTSLCDITHIITHVLTCISAAWPRILNRPLDCVCLNWNWCFSCITALYWGWFYNGLAVVRLFWKWSNCTDIQTHTYAEYTCYTIPSRAHSDEAAFKMKLQSDTAEKSPRSRAAASWERRPFSSQPEQSENILPHTSSLIDSKNSSVNLSGKWDSSK